MTGVEIFGFSMLILVGLGLLSIPATVVYMDWKLNHKHPVVK